MVAVQPGELPVRRSLRAAAPCAALAPLILLGCSRTERQPPPFQTVSAQAAASIAVPSAPAPAPTPETISIAFFTKRNDLGICWEIPIPEDAGKDVSDLVARANAADAGAMIPGMSQVALQDSCEQAFADRLVLASCAGSKLGTLRYYNFDAFTGDADMRDCLKTLRGRWVELPHDSEEYQRAKARHDAERAIEQADRLRQRFGSP